MNGRIRTKKDLKLVIGLLAKIKKMGDEVAEKIKRLPISSKTTPRPVITSEEEALLMHFLIFFRQTAELATCIKGILERKEIRPYKEFLKIGFADLLYQSKKLFETLGMSFNEADLMSMLILGRENNKQKREEYLKKHPDGTWY